MSSSNFFFPFPFFFSFIKTVLSRFIACKTNKRKEKENRKREENFIITRRIKILAIPITVTRDRVIFENHVARTVENIVQRIQRDLDGFTASNRGNRAKCDPRQRPWTRVECNYRLKCAHFFFIFFFPPPPPPSHILVRTIQCMEEKLATRSLAGPEALSRFNVTALGQY